MSEPRPNAGFTYVGRIAPGDAGRSVLQHLVASHRHSDEAVWRARLAAGEVSLGPCVARGDEALAAGDRLAWRRPPWIEPEVPLRFEVVHEDAHLFAIDKPSGLPSAPAGGYLEHTALHLVRSVRPAAVPLHRLGRGTSGLLLFALSPLARRALAADWRARRVQKTYRGLVAGTPLDETWSVDVAIGLVPHPLLGRVWAQSVTGRAALSHVRVLERRTGSSLVEVRIETGRPHQIRIHLAASGHPLQGDPLYAADGGLRPEPALPGAGGYLLHAHRLAFAHPATGAHLELEAPPPAALRLGA